MAPSRRGLVVGCVMIATFMIAVEATIVATAMPRIVGRLGSFEIYGWVFAAYLLAQTSTTVIYGKLADLYGRRPVLIGGIAIFILGSILCGFAWSMMSLIIFRLVQGLGAGAIQPVANTILGDLFEAEERGRVQGWMSAVWGVSGVMGPAVGGFIIVYLSWSWVFWMTVPLGALVCFGLMKFLNETAPRKSHAVDYPGGALFAATVASLMIGLTTAVQTNDGHWIASGVSAVVFAVALPTLIWWERRAAEPIIDFALWTDRLIAPANLATMLACMAVAGLTLFLPMYVQGVIGASPTVAGLTLTMLAIGWPIASMSAPKIFPRIGVRNTMTVGAGFLISGAGILTLAGSKGPVMAGLSSLVMGFGVGLISMTALILIQDFARHDQRGAATASNVFSKALGATLGATVLSAIFAFGLSYAGRGGVSVERIREMLVNPQTADAAVIEGLSSAMHATFIGMICLGVLALGAALMTPRQAKTKAVEALQV